MSVSGLACPSFMGGLSAPKGLVPCRSLNGRSGKWKQFLSHMNWKNGSACTHLLSAQRCDRTRRCVSASFGDMAENASHAFPRIHVRDPYQRLGISREASEEEIQAARDFLINKYAGHRPSIDAINSAHYDITMQKYFERKNPKISLKQRAKEISQSRFIKAITNRFEAPSERVILKTTIAFIVLGVLTAFFPTEEGPTLQVAISLAMCIYFIYQRLKSHIRAVLYGVGSFFTSWLLGTFLMVSVIPPLLQGPRSLEVGTSLITYLLLWVASTYLK